MTSGATAAPRVDRPRGTRSRAGNAMARTQTAVVAGVGSCLVEHGVRRTTMVDIAAAAGIAKATLYNHVRTKGAALGLYADAQIDILLGLLTGAPSSSGPGAESAGSGAGAAAVLVAAADAVATHEVLQRLASAEPAALVAVLTGEPAAARRARVGEALEDLLGADVAPLALRWLSSLLTDPGTAPGRAADGRLLAELGRAFRADDGG